MARMSFADWLRIYDQACLALCGMGSEDLDDMPTARWHEAGMRPATAAKRAIHWTKRGYRPDFAD